MIRFKQRMSLCSEVSIASSSSSDDGTMSAAAEQAQKDSPRHHSPPPVPPVPAVSVNINIRLGRVDSFASIHTSIPPSSDSSLASSSCLDGNRTATCTTTTATAALPMSHVEIPPPGTKSGSSSTPPPAAVTTVANTVSPVSSHNAPIAGKKKRTVSDATDELDSSVSQFHSGNSPIITTTKSRSKRPRTLLPLSAQDSADSPPSSSTQLHHPRLLLACPAADPHHLNPLHCFVRRQIEVFAATPQDVAAPCPGRKVRIQLGQVGLRCVHCRRAEVESTMQPASTATAANSAKHTKRPKRIKRAVCYPSKVSRVYNSVSDMKFDHFGICPHMPLELQNELALLKALHGGGTSGNNASNGGGNKRGGGTASSDVSVVSQSSASVSVSTTSTSSTGASSSSTSTSTSSSTASTAQYYHETAQLIGLVDAPEGTVGGGIRFGPPPAPNHGKEVRPPLSQTPPLPLTVDVVAPKKPKGRKTAAATTKAVATATRPAQHVVPVQPCVPIATKIPTFPQQVAHNNTTTTTTATHDNNNKTFLLAAPEDEQILNPIHCFVRRNVEVFAATAADIAAPAPGRKNRLVVGQVGIRCVHCVHLPPRDRVKRSSCYPPNVSGIYHAVSNMKFDHFGSCKGLDAETRAEFQTLRAACGRKGGGRAAKSSTSSGGAPTAAARGTMPSSTAQYYHDSAQNLGLVDTSDGIRFLPEEAAKLRAAAAMVIQAHQGPSPPPMAAATTNVQTPSSTISAPLPPLDNGARSAISVTPDHSKHPSALPNFAHREPIPDGLSALMMAASQRSAEYAPQMATAKLAV